MVDLVFVVGAPRSGTTLLYKALCLHPDSAWISNWVRRYPGRPELSFANRLARVSPGARARAWFPADDAYAYGGARSLGSRAYPAPTEGGTLFARHLGLPPIPGAGPVTGPTARADLAEALDAVVRWSGAQVLISKCIASNRRLTDLIAAFPGARFVHLVRDGRAVSASLAKVDWWPDADLWWWATTPAAWAGGGGDPWEACARCWMEETELVDRSLGDALTDGRLEPDQVHTIRYEDLLLDPRSLVKTIGASAGLPPSARWDAALDGLRIPTRNDRWRAELSPDAVVTIERVAGPALRRWGYA